MAKEEIKYKKKVIKAINEMFGDSKKIISLIEDKDICFAVKNGFSIETFIEGLVF